VSLFFISANQRLSAFKLNSGLIMFYCSSGFENLCNPLATLAKAGVRMILREMTRQFLFF